MVKWSANIHNFAYIYITGQYDPRRVVVGWQRTVQKEVKAEFDSANSAVNKGQRRDCCRSGWTRDASKQTRQPTIPQLAPTIGDHCVR